MAITRLMVGRRPKAIDETAFGLIDLNSSAEAEAAEIAGRIASKVAAAKRIDYHADDAPGPGEIMIRKLTGIDSEFQADAAWSIERLVAFLDAKGTRSFLDDHSIRAGGWTFYALRADSKEFGPVTLIRHHSPTFSLKLNTRFISMLVHDKLVPVDTPLIAVDHKADAVVIGDHVFISNPQSVERLFVDADHVKALAPALAASIQKKSKLSMTSQSQDWIERACAENVNVARRVQRLIRDGTASSIDAKRLRAGLKDAKLPNDSFGKGKAIEIVDKEMAVALIDIAADLYYQPRFDSPRKVAQYRRI